MLDRIFGILQFPAALFCAYCAATAWRNGHFELMALNIAGAAYCLGVAIKGPGTAS